jgi:putative ABC transport system permease protein
MLAAVLIATLLTLASVARRTRELGTLRAIGWTRRAVVRQVSLEAVGQGVIGGVIGAALGIGMAAAISASGFTLSASVPEPEGPGAGLGFGVGRVGGTEEVTLSAPIDLRLVLIAMILAVLGGLIAGVLGGLRAARLRPADALRSVE